MINQHYRHQFGSAVRAAEGTPDEDGTLPTVRDRSTGRWSVARPPRSGNGMILLVAFATVAVLIWFAA